MHSLAILALFAGSSLAAPASVADCLTSNAAHLASLSSCTTDRSLLAHCLSNLDAPAAKEYIAACHIDAGCSADDATSEAEQALNHCHDMVSGADLRRRNDLGYMPLLGRQASQTGDECLETYTVDTSACQTVTNDKGRVSTTDCSSTTAERSSCKPGKTCSMDSSGTDICMDLQDDLGVAGIVIAIIFASAIVIGVGTLTFLCCKDRKDQKRLQAKAEATALARAATKKKRAEMRQPLMSQQHQQPAPGPDTSALGGGGADPFHDAHRS